MNYSANSYAAMLLCLALSPNKEEYTRPLNTAEYRDVCRRARLSSAGSIGNLMNVDISGLMQLLGMQETEAYRVFLLLSRSVPLSYAMEGFSARGIRIVTEYDEEYPRRLQRRAGVEAPPVLYLVGDAASLNCPSIGILGMSGVKTSPEVRSSVQAVAKFAEKAGYRIMAGGELGISRVTENFLAEGKGCLTAAMAGGLNDYLQRPEIQALQKQDRLCAVSLEHPDSLFTVPHAIARNRMLFSLAEAVFVFNTDGKRGETDALKSRRCDWIYAWDGCAENRTLIHKGAPGFHMLNEESLAEMSSLWRQSRAEQISLFDQTE